MKNLLQTLFFFLLVTQICFGQWYQQNSGTTKNLNAVQFIDANNGLAVGDSGTVLRTNDGGTSWTPVVVGITDNFTGMCFVDASQGWVITGIKSEYYNEMPDSGIILHSTDGGTTWVKQLTIPLTSLNDVTFIDAENGWAVGSIQDSGSIIQRTTNGGTTWDQLSSDTIPAPITSIDFASLSIGWIIPTSMGMSSSPWIYKTTDQGNTWSIQFFVHSGYSGYSFINDIVFHDLNDGIAVGVYRLGLVTSYALIVKTTDGGTNWTQILIDYSELNSVFFSSETEGTVVGEEGVILRTSDGGFSWEELTSGTTNALNNVCFTDALNGWIVGGNGTILHTTNGGGIVPVELTTFTAQADNQKVILKWTTATELNNNGFEIQRRVAESEFATIGFVKGEGTTTNQKEYSYIDKDLVDAKYFYRLKQVDFNGSYEYSNVIEVDVRSLNEYALEQNYPNPFNPITTIGFVLKEKSNAKLTLLNAIGEEVAVLVNEEQDKGFHKVDFNASSLTSGVYFYQLRAGEYTSVKKMILLR